MALLTAEDVHWKQFQATKFREGYDQEEVDEFLDEVVETIATLQDQNASLKTELDEARQQAASGGVAPASSVSMEDVSNSTVQPLGAEELRVMFCRSTLLLFVTVSVTSDSLLI